MPMPGSRRSRPTFLLRACSTVVATIRGVEQTLSLGLHRQLYRRANALVAAAALVAAMAPAFTQPALAEQDAGPRAAEALVPYRIEDDGIPASLTGRPGDPSRGAAVFVNRQLSLCLLCHADPATSQSGAIGPSLKDAGGHLTDAQIRLRIVDPARVNPDTVMPSFYVMTGLNRVGHQWQGRPILNAEQIEDLVAFLASCPIDLAWLAPQQGDRQVPETKAIVPCIAAASTMRNR